MKKLLVTFLMVGVLLSCNDDDLNAVESTKTITFDSDGTITSNGNLCDMSIASNSPTSGTYSISELSFRSSDCPDPEYHYAFEQNGSILIIDYLCFEACRAKYRKE